MKLRLTEKEIKEIHMCGEKEYLRKNGFDVTKKYYRVVSRNCFDGSFITTFIQDEEDG